MNINFIFFTWSLLLLIPIALYGYKKYRLDHKINLIEPIYLFGFIYWLSYGVNFFAVSHNIGVFGWAQPYLSRKIEIEVLILSLLFFYLFVIGYSLADKFHKPETIQKPFNRYYSEMLTQSVIIIFMALTIYKIYFLYTAAAYYGSMDSFRSHFVEYSTGNGLATLLSSAFIEYLTVLSIALLFTEKNRLKLVILLTLIIGNAFIFFYFQTSRRLLLYCIIGVMIYYYDKKKINNQQIILIGMLSIFLLVFLLYYRTNMLPHVPVHLPVMPNTAEFNSTVSSSLSLIEETKLYFFYYLGLVTVSFDMFIHSVAVFGKYPVEIYHNGVVPPTSFFYDQIISFVPRSIFPEKPLVYGDFYLQNLIYPDIYSREGINSGRFPLGIISTGYLYFGIFGLSVIGFAIGGFYKKLYLLKNKSSIWTFIYLYYYIVIFNVIRGGMNTIVNQAIQLSIFLLLLFLVIQSLNRISYLSKTKVLK